MREEWRVAVLDSGLRDGPARVESAVAHVSVARQGSRARGAAAVLGPPSPDPVAPTLARVPAPVASCRFTDDGRQVLLSAVVPDPLGHGTAVAKIICGTALVPDPLGHGTSVAEIIRGTGNNTRCCDLIIGQVLDHRGVTTAAALAAAIRWSVREGANLIHMSLGMREDRQTLAEAVAAAAAAGCIIVASTPARGEVTFPARYPDVIRATGDARCQWDEISDLHSRQADFGGCPRHAFASGSSDQPRLGGASLGAAHVTRFVVEHIAPRLEAAAVRTQLRALAQYKGVEDRSQATSVIGAGFKSI